jgi:hypothetical protein
LGIVLGLTPAVVRAADPLNAMRAFLQADGRGARLAARTWMDMAGLVTWPLEPAWDHLYLIRGFELGSPRVGDAGIEVDVQYTVVAEIRNGVVSEQQRVETRTYHLTRGDDGRWRIRAPAPPPFVFASEADEEALAALLAPDGSDYLSDSAFVWQMLRDAGWTIPYMDTAALATAAEFTTERTAEVGDVALYYDGDQPYHAGIVESDHTVVSATLSGGVRRTPFASFAGEIRYRRPVATNVPTPTPEPRPASAHKAHHHAP